MEAMAWTFISPFKKSFVYGQVAHFITDISPGTIWFLTFIPQLEQPS